MSIAKVFHNRDLFTSICSYLDNKTLRVIGDSMRLFMHYIPNCNTLLYGEVQSGKTSKIMRYIQHYPIGIKVLIIQNNLTMMNQYKNMLKNLRIAFCCISKKNAENIYCGEQVIIAIHNKHRMKSLTMFMNKNNLAHYSLILDESDQCYKKTVTHKIYKNARHILHVTATPFIYKNFGIFNKIVKIKSSENYIGINKIKIIEVNIDKNLFINKYKETREITANFSTQSSGIMLINWANTVSDMKKMGLELTVAYPNIPGIVLSTTTFIYYDGKITHVKVGNVQKLIQNYNNHTHVIMIANRYSNRGINYTNTDYSRFITHQVSCENKNITNFIQKCRIFGNRTCAPQPILYCFTHKGAYISKVKKVINSMNNIELEDISEEVKITKPQLIKLCKDHKIKGYSKLKKQEIIDLLKSRSVSIK